MNGQLFVCYLLFWTCLMRALLVKAQVLPATCGRCGLVFERRALGESVCCCQAG